MKKIIIFGILLCLIFIVFYFLIIKKDKVEPVVEENKIEEVIENIQEEQVDLTTEKQLVGASFEFQNDIVKIKEETETSISLDVNKKSLIVNKKDPMNPAVSETTPIVVSVEKNANPENLQIAAWFRANNPEKVKNSKYEVLATETIKINGIYTYRVRYQSKFELTGGFYDLTVSYIPHGTDIYKVTYYATPIAQFDNNLLLPAEYLQNMREYEQVVVSIIDSISFPE